MKILIHSIFVIVLAACGGGAKDTSSLPIKPGSPVDVIGADGTEADKNSNGIPDRLDEYVSRMNAPSTTKAAALTYYRYTAALSEKIAAGKQLEEAEKQRLMRHGTCYLLTASHDETPRVNLLAEYKKTRDGFNAIYSINGALNGVLYRGTMDKEIACAN